MSGIISIYRLSSILLLLVFVLSGVTATVAEETLSGLDIVPKPLVLKPATGTFTVLPSTVIGVPAGSDELFGLARYLSDHLWNIAGYTIEIRRSQAPDQLSNAIVLSIGNAKASLGDEGYSVKVDGNNIFIAGNTGKGVFYGIQTLRQILMSDDRGGKSPTAVPGLIIEDKPAFAWRGMQLDCSRHFLTKEYVKRYIDLLAFHKLNVFHWHLTDDQGWRIEIKRYPKLTVEGAWRGEGDTRHGGFYTQEEIREVVAYAKTRYVDVVPEIEMPGHATAAIAAYPELSCTGERLDVETVWGIHKNLFCAGKESSFEFLENVLREVCELFPSKYVHIGGDEAQKDKWKACPLCQKRIEEEGLKDENELQGYFTRRIDAFMQTLGRSIVGWDEVLEGSPSKTAIVQSWRGMEGAVEGSKKGHYVISSPYTHVYLDFPNFEEGIHDTGWLRVTTLEKTYSFKPVPEELTPAQAKFILGGEAPMWTERTPQPEVDNNIFPRLCAFSETVWTPDDLRNWTDFSSRMKTHFRRLDIIGVDYFKKAVPVGSWAPTHLSGSSAPLEWNIASYITGPGNYRVTFRHDQGADNVAIEWAALFEDDREIARDVHEGLTGKRHRAHTYRLRIGSMKPGAAYTLKAKLGTKDGTDSKGTVLLRRFDLERDSL